MQGRQEKISNTKMSAVQWIVLTVFLVLAYGLWSLQVRKSDQYETRAEQNRVRRVPMLAPRGKILDREGRIIVDNYPSFSALLLRDQARDLNADAEKIAEGLNIPANEIREKVRRLQLAHTPAFQPIIIKDDITPDERAFIESHKDEFPELETIMVHRRLYPKNGFMAHMIGYVGEVSEDMLNSPKFDLYERGDIVGQSGVEQQYNDILMGKNGSRRVLVDSKGREKGKLSEDPAVVGKPLHLTVDLDIQIAAEQALEGKNGAVVAMDPRTGEILAMASRPTFDPNDFAVRISRAEWNHLVNDPAHPLMNKAIQAQLAPGSVFKIIMSVAGLQEGIAQNLRVSCGGGGAFYGHYYHCHGVHGVTDLHNAIYKSCDTFFFTLAERLGIGKIAKWASALGLGKKTGIDLPSEVSGVMPSEEWKVKTFRQKWYAGEVISVGIGQGAVATSPLQLARAIGGIAMGGVLYRPHTVAAGQLPPQDNKPAREEAPTRIQLDPQNWIAITDAMAAVLTPGGTASSAHLQGIDFAGKTGTAQVVSHDFRKASKGKVDSSFNDNVWFAGIAPRRNPEIVVVVLLEQGVNSAIAGRTASQVIKAYVEKQRHVRNNQMLFSDKVDPGSIPVAALWHSPDADPGSNPQPDSDSDSDNDRLHAGTVLVRMGRSEN